MRRKTEPRCASRHNQKSTHPNCFYHQNRASEKSFSQSLKSRSSGNQGSSCSRSATVLREGQHPENGRVRGRSRTPNENQKCRRLYATCKLSCNPKRGYRKKGDSAMHPSCSREPRKCYRVTSLYKRLGHISPIQSTEREAEDWLKLRPSGSRAAHCSAR